MTTIHHQDGKGNILRSEEITDSQLEIVMQGVAQILERSLTINAAFIRSQDSISLEQLRGQLVELTRVVDGMVRLQLGRLDVPLSP